MAVLVKIAVCAFLTLAGLMHRKCKLCMCEKTKFPLTKYFRFDRTPESPSPARSICAGQLHEDKMLPFALSDVLLESSHF